MSSAMQLYAGFALLVIVILFLIAIAAVTAALVRIARRALARWRGGTAASSAGSQRRSDWR